MTELGNGAALAAGDRARAARLGAGPLQAALDDPAVTDVLVNGDRGVWVDRGSGLEPWATAGLGESAVRALAVRLAAACGQRLDDACPVVDGRLPDGTRVHAVLPPLAADGTAISLRTLRRRALSVAELLAAGMVGVEGAALLRGLVESRANVLVSGATGVGKTTLLAAMLSLVPPDERLVCIEEAPELNPDHPHVVRLQVRRANVQGAGEIGLDQLVRAAVRMRPDRIVLGECRGPEVREVLGALNTGHDGGWATVHANAAIDVPARLVALGALAGMDPEAIAAQAVSALDAVVHLRRTAGVRRLAEVAVLERDGRGALVSSLAATTDGTGALVRGPAWGRLGQRLEAGSGR
jgi:pilus assembly protein CpaF